MTLLSVGNITKSYGATQILNGVSGALAQGERVGLVGINGAGKSTLLRIITGIETADSGQIAIARGRHIASLTQEAQFEPDQTLEAALRSVFASVDQVAKQMRSIEEEITTAPPEEQDALLTHYGRLAERFETGGGHDVDTRITRVMAGLGFGESDRDMLCQNLSGGQRTRAALAQLLLSDADILLLDEPTNHLDLRATEWLEEEIIGWSGSILVASHDRYFLDRIAQKIWEIDWGKLTEYSGNYTRYQLQKAERLLRAQAEYETQQQEIAKTEEYIRRFGAGVRSTQARGRERRLERLERIDRPRDHKHLAQKMTAAQRSGDMVFESPGMVAGYPSKPLLDIPKIYVRRGDRIALIGPNGSGKTTLLRTITGEISALEGTYRIGASVVPGYYAQGHEKLDRGRTVLDEILQPGMTIEQGRAFAAKYMFTGDDIYKQISDLSGGERSRVALARLSQDKSNFLILDEPTNHLDIPSQESLTDMLEGFAGTLLFVSHDRYFIDDLATQIWSIEAGSEMQRPAMRITMGGYRDYLDANKPPSKTISPASHKTAVAPLTAPRPVQVAHKEDQRQQRRLVKQIETLEKQIADQENQLTQITTALEAASLASEVDKVHSLGTQYEATKESLASLMEEWALLAEQAS